METDRNLLFGVLALQIDAITRSQFIEGCSVWLTHRDAELADLLVERGWLSTADRAEVDRLVQRKLARHQGDATASLADAAADPRFSLAALPDEAVQSALAASACAGEGRPGSTVAYAPQDRHRYKLVHRHAAGGIGLVWLAYDAELARSVALKELRPERQGQPTVVERFLREARITGQLEHPGIVPVYELVRQAENGQPFYTMRFLKGRTLTTAIQSYHEKRATGTAGPLELRGLLTAFVAICNAVAYAHARGVIRRDLKPQNIILGDFGEVMVLDWGMAKLVEHADDASQLPVDLHDSGPGGTLHGQVLGTPAYMAPEQAEGRPERVDRASDVYGLGAILYEILAGQPPFSGSDTQAILDRVRHEPPVPPRLLAGRTPPAVESICLKALAKVPAQRFPSAKALAQEVEHFLADEPVSVYRDPLPARLARWGRRHKALSAAAAALLVTALVCLSGGTILLTQANRRTLAERDRAEANFHEAQTQRDLARENFLTARRAVDTYLTQVSEDQLLNEPGQLPLRQKLLRLALDYYQAFLRQQRDDPELRKELADAHRRLGTILSDLSEKGTLGEAEKALQEAIRLFEPLRTEAPADVEIRAGLARACKALAELRALKTVRPEDAEPEARQVIALAGQLHREQPQRPEYGALLGRGHELFGISRARQEDYPEAEKALKEAIRVFEKLTREAPNYAEGRRLFGVSYGNLAFLYSYSYMARPVLQDQALREGSAVLRGLLRDNPHNTFFCRDFCRSLANLGEMRQETGHFLAAERACDEGLPMLLQLVKDNPTVYGFQNVLSQMYIVAAGVKQARGQSSSAAAFFRKGVDLAEQVRQKNPNERDMLIHLVRGQRGLGLAAWRRGDLAAALESYQRAAVEGELLLRAENNASGRRLLLGIREELLALEGEAGKRSAREQLQAQEALLRDWQQLATKDSSPVNRAAWAAGQARLGILHAQTGNREAALRWLGQAITLLTDVQGKQPEDYLFRQTLARLHAERARLLAERDPAAAAQSARQAVALIEQLPPDETAYLVDLACYRALLSTLLKSQDAEAERLRDGAMQALGKAVAAGYDNARTLKRAPDLAVLRSQKDFARFVQQAEQNGARDGP
jgi:serine/threonine-protein kinase